VSSRKHCKVFISYSRHDEALVKPLAALLNVALKDTVFLDVNELNPGDDWEREIVTALQESSIFVLCWCCETRASRFVAKEIALALTDPTKRIVPVLFCSATLPRKMSKLQWIDLRKQIVHACSQEHSDNPVEADKKKLPTPFRERNRSTHFGIKTVDSPGVGKNEIAALEELIVSYFNRLS
jgi:hypothetical protein